MDILYGEELHFGKNYNQHSRRNFIFLKHVIQICKAHNSLLSQISKADEMPVCFNLPTNYIIADASV
jgi:hypothetical protein